jgi:quercetin dioxygenase-like cupin family protein
MKLVFTTDDTPWADVSGLPGARGFEFKRLVGADYTEAYSMELIRLEPGDHSVPHVEPHSHSFYFLEGTGSVTIDGTESRVGPGTVCLIKAGMRHALKNDGATDMVLLTIYDPPRLR